MPLVAKDIMKLSGHFYWDILYEYMYLRYAGVGMAKNGIDLFSASPTGLPFSAQPPD